MELITLPNDKDLVIPDDTTQETWTPNHCKLLLAKRFLSKWIKSSREFGIKHFGLDYVAETEVQMEFQLGIEVKDKENDLNPKDKSRAIVTIEGITQSFKLWQRKIQDDIPKWDKERLERALNMLEPMEKQASEIRSRLQS